MGAWEDFSSIHSRGGEGQPDEDSTNRAWTSELRDKLLLFFATGGYGRGAEQRAELMRQQRTRRQSTGETGQRVIQRDPPKR